MFSMLSKVLKKFWVYCLFNRHKDDFQKEKMLMRGSDDKMRMFFMWFEVLFNEEVGEKFKWIQKCVLNRA